MFERYSEKARRVIFFSRYEASVFGSPAIGSEHLLLGIVRESRDLLQSLAVAAEVDKIRDMIAGEVEVRDRVPTRIDLPFSEAAKHALNYAAEEADHLHHRTITTDHILLGLMREEGSLAQRILTQLGISLDAAVQAAVTGYESQSCASSSYFPGRVTGQAVPNEDFHRVFRDAIDEATLLRSHSARPEHILLALLRDENASPARILRDAGVDLEAVRKRLRE